MAAPKPATTPKIKGFKNPPALKTKMAAGRGKKIVEYPIKVIKKIPKYPKEAKFLRKSWSI